MKKAEIGIIGGSGFYSLGEKYQEIKVDTPFGPPSWKIALGEVSGRKIAFLPRHNPTHDLPPKEIPYKANIWALKSLGVKQILAINASGSLQRGIKPGDFVILDQFIDRTRHRDDTFYTGPNTTHISCAYAFCPQIGDFAYKTAKKLGISAKKSGTVVIVEGPRFSTAAESIWFTKMGWDVINMTIYPEIVLAREQELCYTSLALIVDYDAGIVALQKMRPVSAEMVIKTAKENHEKALRLIFTMIKNWPKKRTCSCSQVLEGARF
jgi:5'-methylthioadenosine phosphorylase